MLPVGNYHSPARRLLAVPRRGSYMHIAKAFDALGIIIACRNLWAKARGMTGAYYNDPSFTNTTDLRNHSGLVADANLPAV